MSLAEVMSSVYAPQPVQPSTDPAGDQPVAGPSFMAHVTHAVAHINGLQAHAGDLVEKVATGQVEEVHSAMIAMEHASLAFNFGLQVRNKALDAYQEIIRMQI